MSVKSMILSEQDVIDIRGIISDIEETYPTIEDPDFIENAELYAHRLPFSLRRFLHQFKQVETSAACVISGYPIDDEKIGLTPTHWEGHTDAERTRQEQILFVLCSVLLGEIFAWLTQQNGYFIHDVFPISGLEKEQIGSSSDVLLKWHTEDAFHAGRGDYLGLMCLRNPYEGITTIGSVDAISLLSQDDIDILYEPRFIIHPDQAHHANNNYQSTDNDDDSKLDGVYDKIKRKTQTSENMMPLLYGNPASPYLCIDPAYMSAADEEAELALTRLIKAIDSELEEVVLEPGDICFIDNFKAVHGRKAFTPKYDGHDRWLKRTNITRDLRKAVDFRSDPHSRIIDIITG